MNESSNISGIQELIDHLKSNGVEEGKQEAEQLLSEARREAKRIEEDAREKAHHMVEEAESEISRMRKSAEQAMELAARDALLRLRQEIENGLTEQLRGLLRDQLSDQRLLGDWLLRVLESFASSAEKNQNVEIILPRSVDPEQKWSEPPSNEDLEAFLGSTTDKMLQESLTISINPTRDEGIVIRKNNGDVEIRLDEETLLDLLHENLMPRFRHLLRPPSTRSET